ncbi:hypothetical protein IC582_017832 [Cucumis melo]
MLPSSPPKKNSKSLDYTLADAAPSYHFSSASLLRLLLLSIGFPRMLSIRLISSFVRRLCTTLASVYIKNPSEFSTMYLRRTLPVAVATRIIGSISKP